MGSFESHHQPTVRKTITGQQTFVPAVTGSDESVRCSAMRVGIIRFKHEWTAGQIVWE